MRALWGLSMEASLISPRVHRICHSSKGGPWIELTIFEPGHKYDEELVPLCTGNVRLGFCGRRELTRFMASLKKELDRFIRD